MLKLSNHVLKWYEKNARILPWRISPADLRKGFKPDPYKIWVSEIMLQQTTVRTVIPYFNLFLEHWSDLEKLSLAEQKEIVSFWAGLGYYSRARNLLRCAKEIIADHEGIIPEEKKKLKSLPGIGEYTASAIRSIAFQKFDIALDGNIERILARLFQIETPIKVSKKLIYKKAEIIFPKTRTGDFCQGLMDLANQICKPKKPFCHECPISNFCLSYKKGVTENIPVKLPKGKKVTKNGYVFFIKNQNNQFLLERRPDKGLLGGLLAFPTSKLVQGEPNLVYPVKAEWSLPLRVVKHEFTHFKLELELVMGMANNFQKYGSNYEIFDLNSFEETQLPTLMRKVLNICR